MKWIAVAGIVGLGILSQAAAEIAVTGQDTPPAKPSTVPKPTDDKGVSATGGEDVLEFLNKDKLHGYLMAVVPGEYGLRWKHSSSDKPIDFGMGSVASATLARRKTAQAAPSTAAIYLTNGDMLPGNLVSLDGEKLVLDTWYAGKINVNRLMVKAMNPNSGVSSVIYEGPTDLTEWTMYRHGGNQVLWKFKNGALYALQSYPIGREIEGMPDMADIQFEAAWRSGYPSFSFMFYTDNIQDNGNGYMLQISGSSIYLQRYSRDSGSRNIGGNDNYEAFNNRKSMKAKINLLVDKSKKAVTLLIDGNMVKQWTDTANFAGKGNGIMFRPNNQGDLKISNIKIAQWDGKLPEVGGVSSDKGAKEDLVRFVNNDKVSGQLKAIAAGNVKFETSYATLDIPLARVAEIVMASEKSERARRNKDDVRAYFADRGLVTIQLARIEKDEVKGKSENFGDISLPLGSLRLLEFSIYQERKDDDSEDDFAF